MITIDSPVLKNWCKKGARPCRQKISSKDLLADGLFAVKMIYKAIILPREYRNNKAERQAYALTNGRTDWQGLLQRSEDAKLHFDYTLQSAQSNSRICKRQYFMFKCKTTNNNSREEAKTGEKWVGRKSNRIRAYVLFKEIINITLLCIPI